MFIHVVACVRIPSFWKAHSIPLHRCIMFCLPVQQSVDIWVVSQVGCFYTRRPVVGGGRGRPRQGRGQKWGSADPGIIPHPCLSASLQSLALLEEEGKRKGFWEGGMLSEEVGASCLAPAGRSNTVAPPARSLTEKGCCDPPHSRNNPTKTTCPPLIWKHQGEWPACLGGQEGFHVHLAL